MTSSMMKENACAILRHVFKCTPCRYEAMDLVP